MSMQKTDDNRVKIFDTTLRDGEQSPGFSMNHDEKLRMAGMLEELGVDIIEAGFPIASQGDFESVRAIAKQASKDVVIAGLCRASTKDIDRAWEALQYAPNARIRPFTSTSPVHMKDTPRTEPDALLEAIHNSVSHAATMTNDVEWSPEDGTRTEPDFLVKSITTAVKAGATTINVPDTVGYLVAGEYAELITMCRFAVSRRLWCDASCVRVQAPVKVFGDLHGQFDDLLRFFDEYGTPEPYGGDVGYVSYLFLGDYVDRGKNGLECIILLLAYKVKYPENFFLLRGNHECASINRIYGFYDECKRRFSVKLWKTFTDCFNCLPVAAVVDEKILCMHGGVSRDRKQLSQIARLERPTDVPDQGLLCDLLWSDPDKDVSGWGENDRGVSYTFGADVVGKFLQKHDYDLIVRAHQVVEDGYEFFADRQLVTIFSAPNYCGEFDNAGAMMAVDDPLMCSFQILKPAEKKARPAGGMFGVAGRPAMS